MTEPCDIREENNVVYAVPLRAEVNILDNRICFTQEGVHWILMLSCNTVNSNKSFKD